ncbi:hypothetical protein EWB00_000306 [Schistosoma japonicum]|uniref:Uncharacterized protein n=1 Tax=Schistosoma japonicum TaxID=6182 RepID=A0A4Z2DJK2_SCHJA|nr:hypothetical protein EWB00_000306 [Schistosoma japonicum]
MHIIPRARYTTPWQITSYLSNCHRRLKSIHTSLVASNDEMGVPTKTSSIVSMYEQHCGQITLESTQKVYSVKTVLSAD